MYMSIVYVVAVRCTVWINWYSSGEWKGSRAVFLLCFLVFSAYWSSCVGTTLFSGLGSC